VPSRLAGTVRRAAEVLDQVRADVVVGFGGYVALPAYFAARRRGVPIVVHEANVRPGLANRVGARMTDWIATGSPDCRLSGGRYLGMPLRQMISHLDRPALRDEALGFFGLAPDRATLLVYGGSQGARRLNDTMQASLRTLREAGIQVLHGYGDKNSVSIAEDPNGPPYIALPYIDRMDLAYAAADLALSRSGMMTCSELAAVGLPSVYVPLPVGNGEQRLNAAPVVEAGGGLLIDDSALTPDWFAANVVPLLLDEARLTAMSEAAGRFGIRDADEKIVELVYAAAGKEKPAARGSAKTVAGAGPTTAAEPAESTAPVANAEPSAEPSAEPAAEPSAEPAAEPAVEPSAESAAEPAEPTANPAADQEGER